MACEFFSILEILLVYSSQDHLMSLKNFSLLHKLNNFVIKTKKETRMMPVYQYVPIKNFLLLLAQNRHKFLLNTSNNSLNQKTFSVLFHYLPILLIMKQK